MESTGEVSSKELLDAQSHLWNHIFAFINSLSFKCALELGIPDAVHNHGKPIPLSELAAVLSIPAVRIPNFQRFMRLLVHSGLFTQTSSDSGEDVYALTTFSAPLIKEKGACITPFLELNLGEFHLDAWQYLSAWFKTEQPSTPFEMAHGSYVWQATGKFPEYGKLVREGLEGDSELISKIIMKESRELFGGVKSLVEVGGGTGRIAVAIKEAFPNMKCTVLDLPHVIAATEKKSSQVEYVAGDMFEHIPPADALLLKWVFITWSDEECVKILKRCKEAIPTKEKGGKVIIIDKVMDVGWEGHKETQTQLYFDAYMNVLFTGKVRTELEWKKLFTEAGFKEYKIIPALGLRAIIEVYA